MTVTKKIDKDEWYPVYTPNDRYGPEVEFTDEEWAQIEAATKAFDAAQELIARRMDEAS